MFAETVSRVLLSHAVSTADYMLIPELTFKQTLPLRIIELMSGGRVGLADHKMFQASS